MCPEFDRKGVHGGGVGSLLVLCRFCSSWFHRSKQNNFVIFTGRFWMMKAAQDGYLVVIHRTAWYQHTIAKLAHRKKQNVSPSYILTNNVRESRCRFSWQKYISIRHGLTLGTLSVAPRLNSGLWNWSTLGDLLETMTSHIDRKIFLLLPVFDFIY